MSLRKYPDIKIGDIFGKWLVFDIFSENHNKYCKCQCSCNRKTIRNILSDRLKRGRSQSCGCVQYNTTIEEAMRSNFKNAFGCFKRDNLKRLKNISTLLTVGEFALLVQQNCIYSNIAPYEYLSPLKDGSSFTKSLKIKIHGLDRINSNGNYQLDNIVACDFFINSGKLELQYNEFRYWIENINICEHPVFIKDLTNIIQSLSLKPLKEIFPCMFKSYKNARQENYICKKISSFNSHKKNRGKNTELSNVEIAALKISPCILCGSSPDINILKQNKCENNNDLLDNMLSHIDRWDNSISDYTRDNCTSLCFNCNYFKNNQTISEMNEKITALKNNLRNLPKTEAEFLEQHSKENTIKSLIKQVEEGKIIDYFDELPKLKIKLNENNKQSISQ